MGICINTDHGYKDVADIGEPLSHKNSTKLPKTEEEVKRISSLASPVEILGEDVTSILSGEPFFRSEQ
jgi:hypothetical protein